MSTNVSYLSSESGLDAVLARIKQAEGARFDADIAKALGMDRRSLAGYKTRGTLPLEHLVQFAASKGYSLEWVLNGRGPQNVEALNRIAETPPAYAGGFNFELHHQVAQAVRELLNENDILIGRDTTNEKVDHLIAYCFDDINKQPDHNIDKGKIINLIKIL